MVRASCMKRRLAGLIPEDKPGSLNGPVPLDDAHAGEPFRDFQGTRGRVRTSTGVSQDRKTGNAEVVSERDHIGRPVANPAPRLKIGEPEAGPIRSDHTNVELLRQPLTRKQIPFEPAAGRAVKVEDCRTIRWAMCQMKEYLPWWSICSELKCIVRRFQASP